MCGRVLKWTILVSIVLLWNPQSGEDHKVKRQTRSWLRKVTYCTNPLHSGFFPQKENHGNYGKQGCGQADAKKLYNNANHSVRQV